MLKLLRKKKVAKRIFYVLAAIIIPAFVIWGSASVIDKRKTPNYAGIIFGKKISFDDFSLALFAWKTQLKLQYGDKAQEIASSFLDSTQGAWDRLILLEEVKHRKIKISDTDVINQLIQLPFLQKNGNFDPQAYNLFLQYSLGITPRIFEEQLRQNLGLARVYEEVTKQIALKDEEVKKEYERQNVQTRVKYAFFPVQGYKDKTIVTDDEVRAYYEKNKEEFKIPPQINIVYIGIDLKEDAPQNEKDEADKKIKSALLLAKKKGFENTAKELNLSIKETGFFGFNDPIPTLGWMPQLSSLLFNLQTATMSNVVELSRGVYIFEIKKKKDAYVPDLKEAKEKATDALLSEKSENLASQKANEFLSRVKTKPLAFEKAAEESGVKLKETPLFSLESYVPELGMADALKEAAFKLKKDEIYEDIVKLDQGFYCFKSMETVAFNEEKFKKDKVEFAKQLLEQKRTKFFNDFFEALKKQANLINFVPETKEKVR